MAYNNSAMYFFETHCHTKESSGFAYDWAMENKLLMSAGSDSHQPEDVGRSGIITEKRITSLDTLKDILVKGAFKIVEV